MPRFRAAALLFDMDGVLVDSGAVVERSWRRWAARRGLDPAPFLEAAHGRRTMETLREVRPDLELAEEVAWLDAAELADVEGIVAVAGAPELLRAVPPGAWALVTSAGRELVERRLGAAGLPRPRVLVSSEDVTRGKPAPDGYLLGARRLGRAAAECVVFEDSPPGTAAGRAAGARVVALTTTHRPDQLGEVAAVVADFRAVRVRGSAGDLTVELDPSG
ncbi:MAG TPA: HAD-IA family hydrolase [Gemmatimonadales bacterium]|jgi:sugar-phosphatase|nr:HAD-IA family hydrolase [Gemmatimonadales bacterium]